jgi:hypothetical protein
MTLENKLLLEIKKIQVKIERSANKINNPRYTPIKQLQYKAQMDRFQEQHYQHTGKYYMPRGGIK